MADLFKCIDCGLVFTGQNNRIDCPGCGGFHYGPHTPPPKLVEFRVSIPAAVYVTIEAESEEAALTVARGLLAEWHEWPDPIAKIDPPSIELEEADIDPDAVVWPEAGGLVCIVDVFDPSNICPDCRRTLTDDHHCPNLQCGV